RGLLVTFPDLGAQVDEVYWMGNDRDGYRVSVRWSATGTHRGYGLYGRPTGRRAHLWGISQLYIQGGLIVAEWNLFNEFDVLAQLLRDAPPAALGWPPAPCGAVPAAPRAGRPGRDAARSARSV